MKKFLWVVAAFVTAIIVASLVGCSFDASSSGKSDKELLETEDAYDRFTMHKTNVSGFRVLVDNETGCQYLCNNNVWTMCLLVDYDGAPLLANEVDE